MNRDSWEILKLADVCSFFNDGNWIESKDQSESGIRLIQTGNIGNGYYIDKEARAKFISEDTFRNLKCTEVFEGDCLVSRLPDPIGRACVLPFVEGRAITAVDCSILRFKPNILASYFVYFSQCKKYALNIKKNSTGSTRKRISRSNLGNILISLPPLHIQEQIVKELDTLSDIIAKKKEQLAELDKLAQATFYDMFGDPVENEKQWKTKKLDTLCTKITDGEHFRPETTSKGVPFLSAKDILQEGISFKNTLFVTQETANKALRRCNPEKNDILIVSRGATIGRMNIVKTDQVFCLLGSVILLKFKQNELSSYFLLQTLRNPDVLNKIRGLSSSSAQQALYLKDLKLLSIPVPPLLLQNQFAEKIEAIEQQKTLINQSIADIQLLFDYTMDKYFN